MAVLRTDNFSAGSSRAGIALPDLRIDVVTAANALVDSQTDGAGSCIIRELGRGVYLGTYEHPDGHRGAAKLMQVSAGPLFLASSAIEPAEAAAAVGIAGAVWRFPDRMLSEIPTSPNQPSSPGFARRCGDSWRIRFEYLGDLTDREGAWFTIKRNHTQTDPQALVQISEAGGLLVVNGAAPASAALGTLVIDEAARTAEATLDEAASVLVPVGSWSYDLQFRRAGDVETPRSGFFQVTGHVTHATQ